MGRHGHAPLRLDNAAPGDHLVVIVEYRIQPDFDEPTFDRIIADCADTLRAAALPGVTCAPFLHVATGATAATVLDLFPVPVPAPADQ